MYMYMYMYMYIYILCIYIYCAAAATKSAKARGAETGIQFRVNIVIEPDDGASVIRADGVPFSKKNLSGKKNNGGFQYEPVWRRRNELGPAQKFTISVPNYRDLCETKKLTLDRQRSHYKIPLTFVDEACRLSSLHAEPNRHSPEALLLQVREH